MTVLLITHYMDEAALSDRIIVMRGGQVLLDGTPKGGLCADGEAQKHRA